MSDIIWPPIEYQDIEPITIPYENLQVGDLVLGTSTTPLLTHGGWVIKELDTSHKVFNAKFNSYNPHPPADRLYPLPRKAAMLVTIKRLPHATSHAPKSAKPAIPDWPLSCPRCGSARSAVLLFMGYDCRLGCYK